MERPQQPSGAHVIAANVFRRRFFLVTQIARSACKRRASGSTDHDDIVHHHGTVAGLVVDVFAGGPAQEHFAAIAEPLACLELL